MESGDFDEMYALATKRGKALEALEKKNAQRRKKGLKPLLDDQAKADLAVSRRRYKTNDPTTVDGAEALKLFQLRKEQMENAPEVPGGEDDEVEQTSAKVPKSVKADQNALPGKVNKTFEQQADDPEAEKAIRQAEAVRRVEDMKNGRINHAGVWSGQGNRVEGGDETSISPEVPPAAPEPEKPVKKPAKSKGKGKQVSDGALEEFKNDLYGRLKVSFEELEKSMSDLQGRVAEIVTASTPAKQEEDEGTPDSKLEELLKGTTALTFNVNGTKMTCNAVKVFYNAPCITILSRMGSATIEPEAGARIRLSYEAGGRKFVDDPVTFVGLRVDLEELGMSLVGFVRDNETDLVEVPDGAKPERTDGGR